MTDQPTPEAALRALVDRAARGVATPAEGDLLRQRIEALLAERDKLAGRIERMKSTNRMVNGGAREARLRAERAEAAVDRIRRLHDRLEKDDGLLSPDCVMTRGTAARSIAAALDEQPTTARP